MKVALTSMQTSQCISDLIELLLSVRQLLSPLVLLLILESVVPITHLLWLAIHDVALVRLHIVFLI